MTWQTDEFGTSHEGSAGALLADGSEPDPVYLDTGSGSTVHSTREWWAYDGTRGTPRAAEVRGSCSCGWRGTGRYPIDWSHTIEDRPHLFGTSGPRHDWDRHIGEVEARSVPLPAELAGLLERVDGHLASLAEEEPLAALRAVAALERTTWRAGRSAARNTEVDEVPWDAVGTALGLTESAARSRLTGYLLRH
ncbi:hypothetical protein [Streptomyces sp. NPDC001985]|uniref:hypothetical protein n=1 Tax=Streptomyces sp. NPDC001985 TaxID=3154406 RepID=UPI0033267978